jgi:hypothetical protein
MARPPYTARPREALLIVRNADGMLEIGKGRIRIAPGAVPYFRRVTTALALVLDLPGGAEAFDHGDALGHTVTIMQPPMPTVPPNAWTLPDDIRAATAAGVPVGQMDANGTILAGTGAGCGSRIVFDPDDWPRRGDPASPASHEVLLKLLQQANAYAGGACIPPAAAETAGAAQGQLQLTCHPTRVGDVLRFPYTVANPGPGDVYVMDAMAGADPATRAACAVARTTVLIGSDGDAVVGTFIPPKPTDRQMAAPVVPLARRLAAGDTLEHRLEIPAPYAETSPWLPDLPPQQNGDTDIRGVVLAIHCWSADTPGMVATEAVYAPGLYTIMPTGSESLISLRFPVTGLRFSQHSDGSSRSPARTGSPHAIP